MTQIRAAVLRAADAPYEIESLELAEPQAGQVLVRIAGAGICHTDALLRAGFGELPIIPGHEGAGIVEAVGEGVHDVQVGDRVVLSFDACHACANCLSGHLAYCTSPGDEFNTVLRNCTGRRLDGTTPVRDASGVEVAAAWFQQSSWATHSITWARDVVVVNADVPIELLGPLGCSVMTGAGAVLNSLDVHPEDSIAVYGVGSVGLSAIMAARVAGATTVIAVDKVPARLQLAKEFGATHVLEAGDDVAEQVRTATSGGVQHALDTTGLPSVLKTAITATRRTGTIGMIAVSQGELTLGPLDRGVGRRLVGIIEGDAVPRLMIPQLINLWQQGRLPFDRLIRTYPLSEVNEAERAAQAGEVVKPVLLPG